MNEVIKSEAQVNMLQAQNVADACRQIVLKTACNIKGKQYVKVEGWQAIAIAHGCALDILSVEELPKGFKAIAGVRKMKDGFLLARGEGFVGNDEPSWRNRPEYAKRAMAQTRAMSRAARSVFSHVIVMIDSNLSTTPAEEMQDFDIKNVTPQRDYDALIKKVLDAGKKLQYNKEQTDVITEWLQQGKQKKKYDIIQERLDKMIEELNATENTDKEKIEKVFEGEEVKEKPKKKRRKTT